MKESSVHVTNMNKALKNIKTDVIVNFIWSDSRGIIIVTNKVALSLDLQMIENYIENAKHINVDEVEVPRLPQSKSYLKIIGIPYLYKNIVTPITLSMVKDVIKKNHIFNNIFLASKPYIIKVSSKSDMAIIWVDIWNVQSGSKAKGLINRYFNIGSYITTIRGTNMNPGVSQYKNCWKWGYTTFLCRIQEVKCVKYNSPHKSKHYCQFAWYCKANKKTKPLRFETKKDILFLYLFKCSNCWGNHQVDLNTYSF